MSPIKHKLNTLGGRVVYLRDLKGWSTAELARQAGFAQPTVWSLEKDKTKEVSARLLWGIAKALGTTPDYLWTGHIDPDEGVLLAAFRKLDERERSVVLRAAGVGMAPTQPAKRGDSS